MPSMMQLVLAILASFGSCLTAGHDAAASKMRLTSDATTRRSLNMETELDAWLIIGRDALPPNGINVSNARILAPFHCSLLPFPVVNPCCSATHPRAAALAVPAVGLPKTVSARTSGGRGPRGRVMVT